MEAEIVSFQVKIDEISIDINQCTTEFERVALYKLELQLRERKIQYLRDKYHLRGDQLHIREKQLQRHIQFIHNKNQLREEQHRYEQRQLRDQSGI